MGFDDIIGTPSLDDRKIVHVEIDVEVFDPWTNEPDDVIEVIGQETAARMLMADVFDRIPILRESLAESLVDLIGNMPKNSKWETIVDALLDRIFWK